MKYFLNTKDYTKYLLLALLALVNSNIFSQNTLPSIEAILAKQDKIERLEHTSGVTGIFRASNNPQNCDGAIPVCSQSYTQSTSYSGDGGVQEVNNGCLASGETNSVWYIFTTQTAGNFGFDLITANDYDWALFDITTIGCAGVPSATPVRCNFSATNGNTGMDPTGVNPSETFTGGPYSTELAVGAGETYALIIDNWSADANGYTLNFTTGAGYTSITDVVNPLIATINQSCVTTDRIVLTLSENIQCSSIAADGSDFSISGPASPAVLSASGVNCTGTLVNQVEIVFDNTPQIASGTYTLTINLGGDGNTLLDKCDNPLGAGTTANFEYLGPITLTPDFSFICTSGDPIVLTAVGHAVGETYTLTPGGATNTTGIFNVNPTATTTYTVSATLGACTQTDTTLVTLIDNVVVAVTPIDPTLCSGTVDLIATTTINGTTCTNCNYNWDAGAFTQNNVASSTYANRPAGTYTVTSTTSQGCSSTNTASTTVSLASAGGGASCDVLYVSHTPTGTMDGLTKGNPTDLQTALNAALCTNTIIKMEGGNYSFSDKIDINSFVTIEGGYNAAFTIKSSDMTSGTATTLQRTGTADSDDANSCTMFDVVASADNWRLQDLRIEMPDNSGLTQVTNYGIYIPSGSTGYNITRCYIDGGTGSNGVAGGPGPTLTFASGAVPAPLADVSPNLCEGSDNIVIPAQACTWAPSDITVHYNATHSSWADCYSIRLFTPYGDILSLQYGTIVNWASGTAANCDFNDAGTFATWASGGSTGTSSYRPQGDANAWCGSTPTVATFGAINGGTAMNLGGTWSLEVERGGCASGTATFTDWYISVPGCPVGGTPAGNTYGIYSVNSTGANVVDCQITTTASTLGTACDLCDPADASYTDVVISTFPIITAENISCTNSNIDFSTTDATPEWTSFGASATAIVPTTSSTVLNNQYTTTGRKTIGFTGDVTANQVGGVLYSEDFEGFTTGQLPNGGWTEIVSTSSTNRWGIGGGTAVSGTKSLEINNNGIWDTYDNTDNANKYALSPAINTTGMTNLFLDFNWICNGEPGWDELRVYYSTNGTTVTAITGWLSGQTTIQNVVNLALPVGAENQPTLYLVFRWDQDGNTGSNVPAKVDDIVLTGDGIITSATAVTYTDFVNMTMDVPSAGSVFGSTNVCPGTYNFASSEAGTNGYSYVWSVTDPVGGTSTIATSTLSATDIDFTNTTTGNITFVVALDITSECCGPLAQITYNVVITPTPTAPSVVSAALTECEGGSVTMSVSSPNATYTYDWYDAATAGNLLGTGTSYTLNPVPNGGGNYYVQATSANGCPSNTRTLVVVTERNTDPTGNNNSYCTPGIIVVDVNPVAGTTYNWYDAAVGGSLLQSSVAIQYGVNVPGPAPNTVSVWVTATEPGCSESGRVQVDASITAGAGTTTWTGATSTNWFDPTNWTDCVPNCATDAVFGAGAVPNECNIKFSEGIAAGGDGIARVQTISIDVARTITWGESKSILNVCEHFTHNGTITMASMGKVAFVSTDRQQNYSKGAGASGNFYTLEINNTNATPYVNITGTNNMEVATDGQLVLTNGLLVTGTNLIVINNTALTAITGQTIASYVYGIIRRFTGGANGNYSFPVGNSTAYELMDLIITSGNTTNYLDVYFSTAQDATGSGLPIAEPSNNFMVFADAVNTGGVNATTGNVNGGIWTVTPNAGTANYDMTLYGRNFDNASNTHTILKRTTAGPGAWTIPGTYGFDNLVGNLLTVNRTGYSGFSQFTIVYADAFLSIELLSFDGEINGDNVDLFWTTVSEINNDYFTIERSIDAVNFEFVGNVTGAGTSTATIQYDLTDKDPYDGLSYYRLKQTDFDGTYTYSQIVPIEFIKQNDFFSIYPNPITDEATISFSEETKEVIQLEIYDAKGKIVHKQQVDSQTKKVKMDLSKIETGVYFIIAKGNRFTIQQSKIKFVKQ